MRTIGYINDKRYLQHDAGFEHPESPARLIAIDKKLQDFDLELLKITPRIATQDELLLVHTDSYIQLVAAEAKSGIAELSTGDVAISPESFDIAKLAVGGVLAACDAVMVKKINCAFCAVRPPGHHASSDKGMGFCIFNNVAIAARYLQQKYNLERILIVDWDIHHGNGTQETFYADNSVLYFSTHQKYCYPGTGANSETGIDDGVGFTVNVNLPPRANDNTIITAFKKHLVPKADTFRPDFILICAGFDSRQHDPLGTFNVTDEGFAELTKIIKNIADKHCHGRIVSVLEGGYDPEGLACAVETHMRVLAI